MTDGSPKHRRSDATAARRRKMQTTHTTADHGSKRSRIVEELLNQIVQGKIAAGTRLITQSLEKQFQTSATPIREALAELAGIGIIELLPNRGATVREVTRRDIKEISQVRRALECEAIRLAVGKIDPQELNSLKKELKQVATKSKTGKRFTQLAQKIDSELHDLIAHSSGNQYLIRELQRFSLLFRSFRDASWAKASPAIERARLTEEAAEHEAIVDALLKEDRRLAIAAMKNHIQSSARYWMTSRPRDAQRNN